jgi:uncharacterized membrane protein YgcG
MLTIPLTLSTMLTTAARPDPPFSHDAIAVASALLCVAAANLEQARERVRATRELMVQRSLHRRADDEAAHVDTARHIREDEERRQRDSGDGGDGGGGGGGGGSGRAK